MRLAIVSMTMLLAGFFFTSLTGCQTESPAATDALGAYSTMIDSSPDKVTVAAQKAASELGVTDVVTKNSRVDCTLVGRTAQGDSVSIVVERAGDNASKVTIHVGANGDDTLSKQLVVRMTNHLS